MNDATCSILDHIWVPNGTILKVNLSTLIGVEHCRIPECSQLRVRHSLAPSGIASLAGNAFWFSSACQRMISSLNINTKCRSLLSPPQDLFMPSSAFFPCFSADWNPRHVLFVLGTERQKWHNNRLPHECSSTDFNNYMYATLSNGELLGAWYVMSMTCWKHSSYYESWLLWQFCLSPTVSSSFFRYCSYLLRNRYMRCWKCSNGGPTVATCAVLTRVHVRVYDTNLR